METRIVTHAAPIHCLWDGESFVPTRHHAQRCDRNFVIGETYPLAVHEERSLASHRQYFASIRDGWMNLREGDAERFPSPEHLRKRALVDAGFYDEEIIDCGSNKIAPNVGAAIRKRDDFAIIFIRDQFVIVRTAKSQSMKAMGKKDFQASKVAVLDIIASMVGVKPEQIEANARSAA